MIWYSHLFQNFPQFIVIHTVKGFDTATLGIESTDRKGPRGLRAQRGDSGVRVTVAASCLLQRREKHWTRSKEILKNVFFEDPS